MSCSSISAGQCTIPEANGTKGFTISWPSSILFVLNWGRVLKYARPLTGTDRSSVKELILYSSAGESDKGSVPALGRPFRLGDFYDVNSNKMVLGLSYWSFEQLQQKIFTPNYRTRVRIVTLKG